MTDLVVSVRLKYDGSGVVGQVQNTKAEVVELKTATTEAGAALRTVGTSAEALRPVATNAQAAAQQVRAVAAEAANVGGASGGFRILGANAQFARVGIGGLATGTNELAADLQRMIAEAADAATRISALTGRIGQLEAQLSRSKGAFNDNTAAANRNQYAIRNVGQQFGDFGLQVASGQDAARAFGQQAGQLGYALSEMEGKAGAVGRFLTSPWGIAVTIGAAVLTPLIEKIFSSSSALKEQRDDLEKAAQAADSYGNAQSALGNIIDLTTGKLKTHNLVLIQTIRLQAQANLLAAQADQKKATGDLASVASPSIGERFGVALSGIAPAGNDNVSAAQRALDARRQAEADLAARLGPLSGVLATYSTAANDPQTTQQQLDRALTSTLSQIDALGAAGRLAGRDLIDAKKAVLALGTAINDQRANQQVIDAVDGKGLASDLRQPGAKGRSARTDRSAEQLANFGQQTADRIRQINAEFDRTPTLIDRANAATHTLDALIASLEKRKPPNFQQLIADARTAKTTIEEGLSRPYAEFIEQQQSALDIQHLIVQGRADEADALRIITGLERTMGPLSEQRKAAVLATVQALRAEQREADILREKQQKYLETLGDIKSTIMGALTGGIDGIKDIPTRVVDAFKSLSAKMIFDRLFGDAFRELQDQVDGTNVVQDASAKMARAVDAAATSIARLGDAADSASSGVASTAQVDTANSDIVVTGRRSSANSPEAFFQKAIGTLAKGVGISDDAANKIGAFGGKAIKGAAEGAFTNSFLAPLGKALGFKTSGTGAQIGGAIGSLSGVPGGDIIGSIIGSIVGGLFKKTKKGYADNISVSDGGGVTFDTVGNSASREAAAGSLAGAFGQQLDQIADALGGSLDSGVNLGSLGVRKKEVHVRSDARQQRRP